MIYLGIGSNLKSIFGNRFKNINLAVSLIQSKKIKVLKKSSYYETLSYPDKKKPKFINIVIAIKSLQTPSNLMKTLLSIEKKLGRIRLKRNDPRTCDIDILDYNNKVFNIEFNNSKLQIPHRSLTERNFVLYPLKEVCPNWSHPKTKVNIDTLIRKLKKNNNEITKLSQNDINKYVK